MTTGRINQNATVARDRANGHAEDETGLPSAVRREQSGPRHHTGHPDDLSPTVVSPYRNQLSPLLLAFVGSPLRQPSSRALPLAERNPMGRARSLRDSNQALHDMLPDARIQYTERTRTLHAVQPSRGNSAASPTSHTIAPYHLRTVGRRTSALQTEPSQSRKPVCLLTWTRIREVVGRERFYPTPTLLPPRHRTPSGH